MNKIFNLYKKIGQTPLEVLELFRIHQSIPKSVSMTYAGRLDPMAEGVMIILSGDEVFNKEKYLDLPKEYEAEVLFGFETDSFDLLGMIVDIKSLPKSVLEDFLNNPLGSNLKSEIEKYFQNLKGKIVQQYPVYSSRTVNGVALWQKARNNDLDKIVVPNREVEIYKSLIDGFRIIEKEELRNLINQKINLVKGDFRQQEILHKWSETLDQIKESKFLILKIKISCSSGTYIRSIASNLGKYLNTPALALSIKRIKVGDFKIEDSISI